MHTSVNKMNSKNAENSMESFQDLIKPPPPMICKRWRPWIPNQLEPRLSPMELQIKVLESTRIQRLIEEVSKSDNRDPVELKQHITSLLLEIGLARSLPTIRTLGVIMNYFLTRICEGLYVNVTSLNRLKSQVHGQPVLYLPSHRSYADFILMTYVCFSYQIEIPGIAAGMDFLAMGGMGEILRKTGAFFMRRSFVNDKLYFTTFKEYIHKLMTVYHTGLEFFIEGTRSRSCKSLPPKIGLLAMCLEPLFMGEIPDITIVPVSISYEKPMEEQLFVYELLGVPKPKESTKGMFKAFSILKKNFGSVYFDFGQPFSVKEYLGNCLNRFKHALEPAHVQILSKNELNIVNSLAFDVINMQQSKIVMSAFNLIAVYYNYQKFKGNTLSFEELCTKVQALSSIFQHFGARCSIDFHKNNVKDMMLHAIQIHSNILNVNKSGQVEMVSSSVDFKKIDRGKMKAHKLHVKTMTNAVPIFSLQLYINPTLYWLARPGMVLLCAIKFGSENVSKQKIFPEVFKLRQLFSLEFVLHPEKAQKELDDVIEHLHESQLISKPTQDSISLNPNHQEMHDVIVSVLAPFLSCYLILVDTILSEFSQFQLNEKLILVKIQQNVESLLNQRIKQVHPYSLCLDTITLGVQSLCNIGCLEKQKNDKNEVYYQPVIGSLQEWKDFILSYTSLLNYNFLYYQAEPVLPTAKL